MAFFICLEGRTSTFAKYDYGPFGNMRRYGTMLPPVYALSNIPTKKMLLINSVHDALADPVDVGRLVFELGSDVNVRTNPNFGHLDFPRRLCQHSNLLPDCHFLGYALINPS